MANRSVVGFIVVTLLAAGVAPCDGWQSSAKARHDCCAEGSCPSMLHEGDNATDVPQATADRCCATSESKRQRDASQSASSTFAVAPPALVSGVPFFVSIPVLHVAHPEDVSIHSPPAELHVLFAVFLV